MGGIVSSQAFLPPHSTYNRSLKDLVWITEQLPALLLRCEPAQLGSAPARPTYTILFSHGNAEDLGGVAPWLRVVRDRLRVNVLCYEYRGYGLHQGASSEQQCYSDARAAYRY
eukprot:RCo002787